MQTQEEVRPNGDVELLTASEAQAAEDDEPRVYDSTIKQRIPTMLVTEGEVYEVELIAEPVSDHLLAQYARKCARAAEGADEDETGIGARVTSSLDAAVGLFDSLISDIEGVGEEGEEKPPDWRNIFTPQDKATILDTAIFGITPLEPQAAKADKRPRWGAQLQNAITRLRVPFDGRYVVTSHNLKKPDAKVFSDYAGLSAKAYGGIRGNDGQMVKLAALYDSLYVGHENYAGPVPLHHKAIVLIAHLNRQSRAVRKN